MSCPDLIGQDITTAVDGDPALDPAAWDDEDQAPDPTEEPADEDWGQPY